MALSATNVEEEYHGRVDDLVQLLKELTEIEQQIEDKDQPKPNPELWDGVVTAVEDHVGDIGLPFSPKDLDRHSDPFLSAPAWQGDHISVEIEWRDGQLHVLTTILPHVTEPCSVFYYGFVSDIEQTNLNKLAEWAKSISPEEIMK